MTGTASHSVLVEGLGFAVSGARAKAVLEAWWVRKEKRKRYMRERRAGKRKGVPE